MSRTVGRPFTTDTARAAQASSPGNFTPERARAAGRVGGRRPKHHPSGRPMGTSPAEWKR